MQEATTVTTESPAKVFAPIPKRYLALDAFRGFIMFLLASEGFGLAEMRNVHGWSRVASWFNHVPWEGAVFWDLIQPAFMFMVGAAMPFALAKRKEEGATSAQNLRHVLVRSLRLIIMCQVLVWVGAGAIKPNLIVVLGQIAFTYFLTYLIMDWEFRWQAAAGVGLLVFWTALLFLFPGPDGPFSKTGHVGLVVDRWIFHYDYDPAYSTLNFLASTVWTLAGMWVGRQLMTPKSHGDRLKWMAGLTAISFGAGLGLSFWIPMIKQLCTASFILYSLGWVLLMQMCFYFVVEVLNWRKWTFPLVVVGANSIFIYSLGMILREWLDHAVGVFTFHYQWLGILAPVAQSCTVLAVMWYACYWLYQRKIFLKL
jgi:heparan-alpha-glucosaminide N-acetyltransferase